MLKTFLITLSKNLLRLRVHLVDYVCKLLKTDIMNELDALKQEIENLKGKLTGNMMEDMDIRDKIHNLEMKVSGTKPMDTRIDCVGCGS